VAFLIGSALLRDEKSLIYCVPTLVWAHNAMVHRTGGGARLDSQGFNLGYNRAGPPALKTLCVQRKREPL